MKSILLVCDLGMSTSLVVKKMLNAAQKRGLEINIQAKGSQDFRTLIQQFDCALLGPQIAYKLSDFQNIANEYNKKVDCINMMDYGMTDGEKILDHALSLLEDIK
ncbi:PTS sugar transporter subunit IIB [Testudinibacter aquarius]|uniref:PTS sugar transporter subunit IIB n=1 Tax=Testudinibacter aquarius TaxID=1524974 RepID=A0A4R3Y0Y3_9PAST|nr:PTS sugar transporter subunit IIB [Testudinibacter aquarius]KAE9529954.1 PTS sugar transporter subunit IIB [Testudinibacter aquarius]TCV83854.1 PTS system cellobiose-specific IIB component [Testudinibacter aquarius]TNG87898.1 PTS sugar transporter subunit IIB [Testudinibacter aquarius]